MSFINKIRKWYYRYIIGLKPLYKYQKGLRIIDPERLNLRKEDTVYSKNYNKLKKTYEYGFYGATGLCEAQRELNRKGKRVKHWKLVKIAYDISHNEYIPIFYKKRKRKR